ncbi:MAG: DHH family phosphoesterase, partial [Candidatus Hydrogenedentes bacterium]|nr:DHH family phosphoesterase [Candidatus Hydrogenedentota bacterium]
MRAEHIYSEIWSLFESSRSVVISSHARVDGDALGSMLALRSVLLDMGKTVRLVHADPVPELLRYLADWQTVSSPADIPVDETYDLGVVLDSGTIARLHEAEPIVRRASKLVNIDHHRDWEDFGGLNLIDTRAAAVGEILGELFDWAEIDIAAAAATALYTSIATDTGGFRYTNTTARTHRIAANLLDRGADAQTVNQHLYSNRPLVEFRLLGSVLGTLEQRCGGRVTWMSVDAKMLSETGANLEHVEGFVNYPRSV